MSENLGPNFSFANGVGRLGEGTFHEAQQQPHRVAPSPAVPIVGHEANPQSFGFTPRPPAAPSNALLGRLAEAARSSGPAVGAMHAEAQPMPSDVSPKEEAASASTFAVATSASSTLPPKASAVKDTATAATTPVRHATLPEMAVPAAISPDVAAAKSVEQPASTAPGPEAHQLQSFADFAPRFLKNLGRDISAICDTLPKTPLYPGQLFVPRSKSTTLVRMSDWTGQQARSSQPEVIARVTKESVRVSAHLQAVRAEQPVGESAAAAPTEVIRTSEPEPDKVVEDLEALAQQEDANEPIVAPEAPSSPLLETQDEAPQQPLTREMQGGPATATVDPTPGTGRRRKTYDPALDGEDVTTEVRVPIAPPYTPPAPVAPVAPAAELVLKDSVQAAAPSSEGTVVAPQAGSEAQGPEKSATINLGDFLDTDDNAGDARYLTPAYLVAPVAKGGEEWAAKLAAAGAPVAVKNPTEPTLSSGHLARVYQLPLGAERLALTTDVVVGALALNEASEDGSLGGESQSYPRPDSDGQTTDSAAAGESTAGSGSTPTNTAEAPNDSTGSAREFRTSTAEPTIGELGRTIAEAAKKEIGRVAFRLANWASGSSSNGK